MIEAYAFLAAFAAQILAASVLYPAGLIKYVQGWARNFGSERFAQLYPGVDYSRWVERFVTGYRAANIVIGMAAWTLGLCQLPLDGRYQTGEVALHHVVVGAGFQHVDGRLLAGRAGLNADPRRLRVHVERQADGHRVALVDLLGPADVRPHGYDVTTVLGDQRGRPVRRPDPGADRDHAPAVAHQR